MNITLSDIGGIFRELPDEDQVRLLAYLADRLPSKGYAWDELWRSLRGLAEEATGFDESQEYSDMLRAEDLVPLGALGRDAAYERDRDARLRFGLDRACTAWGKQLERQMREAA